MTITRESMLYAVVLLACSVAISIAYGPLTGSGLVVQGPQEQVHGLLTLGPYLPDLMNATIFELQDLMQNDVISSVLLTKAYLARISEVNAEVHAVLELNPKATESAARLDAERQRGSVRSPLHGIPILVKDNIATFTEEGNTTVGSYALLGSMTGFESTVVRRLKAAGAVILGKTNMDEWAGNRGLTVPEGWSARGNLTTNPYYPAGGVCGSSGGSAVSSAVGLAAATLGTQTSWSIDCPASRSNVVGLKPTRGLTSRYGIVPISLNFDSVGPIARTVRDAATLLQVIAGPDPRDLQTLTQPSTIPDYSAHLRWDALNGTRIGVLRRGVTQRVELALDHTRLMVNHTEVYETFNQSVDIMRELGADVVDPVDIVNINELLIAYDEVVDHIILTHDFKVDLQAYLHNLASSSARTLQDVIDFNNAHARLEIPDAGVYDQRVLKAAVMTDGKSNHTYVSALKRLYDACIRNSYIPTIEKYKLDIFVLPTEPLAGILASCFDAPVASVPMGFLSDSFEVPDNVPRPHASFPAQPFGLSFIGPKWSEARLLGCAYSFETKAGTRKKKSPYAAAAPTTQLGDIPNA